MQDSAGRRCAAAEQIESICRTIAAGRQASKQLATFLQSFGLSEAEFRLLWLLRAAEETLPEKNCLTESGRNQPDQKQLALLLGLSPAQVSALVERLQTKKLILGSPTPEDRRRQLWRLNTRGLQLIGGITDQVELQGIDWNGLVGLSLRAPQDVEDAA